MAHLFGANKWERERQREEEERGWEGGRVLKETLIKKRENFISVSYEDEVSALAPGRLAFHQKRGEVGRPITDWPLRIENFLLLTKTKICLFFQDILIYFLNLLLSNFFSRSWLEKSFARRSIFSYEEGWSRQTLVTNCCWHKENSTQKRLLGECSSQPARPDKKLSTLDESWAILRVLPCMVRCWLKTNQNTPPPDSDCALL